MGSEDATATSAGKRNLRARVRGWFPELIVQRATVSATAFLDGVLGVPGAKTWKLELFPPSPGAWYYTQLVVSDPGWPPFGFQYYAVPFDDLPP